MSSDVSQQREWMVKTELFIDQIIACSYITPDQYMEMYTIMYKAAITVSFDYNQCVHCLKGKFKHIYESTSQLVDEEVLQLYQLHQLKHKQVCKYMDVAFSYINRHHVRHELAHGRRDVYTVGVLTEKIWKEVFFIPLLPRVIQGCLNLINTYRKNNYVSTASETIRRTLELFFSADFHSTVNRSMDSPTYDECFEEPFLRLTEEFYRQKNILPPGSSSLIEYLSEVACYYEMEIDMAKSFLPATKCTQKLLTDVLDQIFRIDVHLKTVSEKVENLLATENSEELLQYRSIIRIPRMKQEILSTIETHAFEKGIRALHSVSKGASTDPQVYVETIVDVRQKSFGLIQAFKDTQHFSAMLDRTCARFINNNDVSQTAGSAGKSTALLVRYCDQFLRKRNSATEKDDIEKMMIVFNCLEDKDLFEELFRRMLTKLLISQPSASHEDEKAVIKELTQLCGSVYTLKLRQMLQDIIVSGTLVEQYRADDKAKDNLFVLVLSSNSWSVNDRMNFTLPIELQQLFSSFMTFYASRYPERKLNCLHQYSYGALRLLYTNREYVVHVTTYQMAVLLLFNRALQWTVGQIHDETQIELTMLSQILDSLIQAKLLICEETTRNDRSIIKLADHFQSNKLEIKVPATMKFSPLKTNENVLNELQEERKLIIQTAIVRIMKAKQSLKHACLTQEVIEQLSSRFKPEVSHIKKCIEILIEKEFLQRMSDDKDLLRYIN